MGKYNLDGKANKFASACVEKRQARHEYFTKISQADIAQVEFEVALGDAIHDITSQHPYTAQEISEELYRTEQVTFSTRSIAGYGKHNPKYSGLSPRTLPQFHSVGKRTVCANYAKVNPDGTVDMNSIITLSHKVNEYQG